MGDDRALAIVSGYAPEVRWGVIMRAATRIRNGLPWVTTNTDLTLPTDDGLAPGNGLLVRLISDFAEVTPQIAGKPQRPLLDETRRRVEGEHPLMIGDRLDTDIAGAHRAETDSLLVMTGVTGLAELVGAPPEVRPCFVAADLTGLLDPHPAPVVAGAEVRSGDWVASVHDGVLGVDGSGSASDWWAAVAVAGWRHLDRTGAPVETRGLVPPSATGLPEDGSLPA